jgi:hypothetical protein
MKTNKCLYDVQGIVKDFILPLSFKFIFMYMGSVFSSIFRNKAGRSK